MDGWMAGWMDRKIGWIDRYISIIGTCRETDRQTASQTDSQQAGRQARQAGRQTYIQYHVVSCSIVQCLTVSYMDI